MGYPLTLATRYLRAKKAAFVSVGTAFAILGVALGVAALATVMSVTGGFQSQFREKVLGVNAHVLVLKYSADFREYRDIMKVVSELPGVEGVGPFTINPMMVSHGTRTATGVLLKGVDPDQMHRVLDLPKHLVEPREARETGRIDGLRRPGAKPAERPTDPKKSQGFSPFGDKPIPPDLPYEKDDQGRPKAVIQEIERSIREHEAKAQGSSSSKFEAAPAPAPASAPPGGSAPPASSAAPAEPAPEEDGPKPLAPGAPVGAVEPEGGYASRLPDAEDELDPSIVPDPCNDPALVAQMPGAIVGVTLARNLQLKLGDCLQVTSPTIGYSYSGRAMRPPVAKPFRVIGIFDAGFDQYDSKLVYTDLYEAQTFYDSGDSVTGVEMKVADIEKAREIARQIDARLANGIYHTMDWEELNHGLFTALRIQQIGMSSVLALIIVVAAFTVVATLIMVVLDKKKEIAVLKAMGATDGAILRVFLYQGGIIGGLGTALGLGLGLLVCKGLLVYGFKLDPKVYFISQLPVNVRPAEFLLTGFIAILICLVATVAPALYAARMRPADGLRELHLPSRNKEAEGPGNHGDDHPRGRGEFFSVDLRGGRVAPVGGGALPAGDLRPASGRTTPRVSPAMRSHEIRRAFLDFFAQKGHQVCPSSSLIPNDPTLMFPNAGMVPFKDVFTGKERRAYTRAASSQKCIRISGKHNDLENVGVTARHHTFFEMLGNFSFGDYFKEGAIQYCWEFLTQVAKIPTERAIITIFGGEDDLPADDEARALWKEVTGFSDDRIRGMGKADNFWQMGDTGPCGPCSEVHFWLGPIPEGGVPYHRFGEEPSPDGNGWFEIWNLVFMQFERSKKGDTFVLEPLPAPSIDTGMGLERIASVLQGVTSNYDTDLLVELVQEAGRISGKTYRRSQHPDDTSMRVIADHARLTAFLISEGVFPDNTGRSYVLRRVMRRAIRHGHLLGIGRPFLHQVALKVVEVMGDDYPQLRERRELIASITKQEEVRFRKTLARGLQMLDEEFSSLWAAGERKVPSPFVARLKDTYGFPIDLTRVISSEQGFSVDEQEAESLIEEWQKSGAGGKLNADEGVGKVLYQALDRVPGKQVAFTGYEAELGQGTVVALIVDGILVDEVSWQGGDGRPGLPDVDVVVDTTPFYGQGGGQVGDQGEIRRVEGNGRVTVRDTTKPVPGLVVHHGRLAQGGLKVGDKVELEVDHDLRSATRRNHSATHLLHWALGAVLGEHVQQKGSLVGPDTLRFDFSHSKPMTQGEIERVEELVNQKILVNAPVETAILPIDEAKKSGARAIFEEKYGDTVRVLTMTRDSVELCGGTHVRALGDIGLFKILGETGVAAGVRRIEAATGFNALRHIREQEALLREIAAATRTPGRPRVEAITALNDRVRELEKERAELVRKLAMGGGGGVDGLLTQAREIQGVKVLGVQTEVGDPAALREMAEQLRDKLGDSVVLVASPAGGKVSLVVMVAKSLNPRLKAGDLIKDIAQIVGGKGGGRPDMAQAGGPDVAKIGAAVAAIHERVAASLG